MKTTKTRIVLGCSALLLVGSLLLSSATRVDAQGGAGGATARLQIALNALVTTLNGLVDGVEGSLITLVSSAGSLVSSVSEYLSENAGVYGTVRLTDGTSYVTLGALTPCQTGTWLPKVVNIASGSLAVLIENTGGASDKVYICDGFLMAHAAVTIAVTEDTDADNCNSSEAALAGGTSDAEGAFAFAANGGWNPTAATVGWKLLSSAGKDVCGDPNGTGRWTGVLWYVIAP